jgi:hypothetical protein
MTILLREGEFILMSTAPKSPSLAGRFIDYIEVDVRLADLFHSIFVGSCCGVPEDQPKPCFQFVGDRY